MTENPNNLKNDGTRRLLRLVLVLQVVILAWLAKNHLDGAFTRSSHTDTPAVATNPDTSPSLESSVPNAPSFFSSPSLSSQFYRPHTRRMPPSPGRLRAEMEAMMAQADRAFTHAGSLFDSDAGWASLPASPALSLRETEDAYLVTVPSSVAGPDSLDVQLDGRLLKIASRQASRTATGSSSQQFSTRWMLPGPADPAIPFEITNEADGVCIRISKPVAATASLNP